jgi:hypothetical protein
MFIKFMEHVENKRFLVMVRHGDILLAQALCRCQEPISGIFLGADPLWKNGIRAIGRAIFLDHFFPLPYEKGVLTESAPVPGGTPRADIAVDRGAQ